MFKLFPMRRLECIYIWICIYISEMRIKLYMQLLCRQLRHICIKLQNLRCIYSKLNVECRTIAWWSSWTRSREIGRRTWIRHYIATRSRNIMERNVETISTDFTLVCLSNRASWCDSSRLIADERREENQLFLPAYASFGGLRITGGLDNKGASRFTMHCIAQSWNS